MKGDLTKDIAEIMSQYTEEVEEDIRRLTDEISKEAVKTLKATSPKKTGKYAKGWTRKKEKNGYIVYNRTKPGLAHLLEKGHAKVGGGRVIGKPHIGLVEEQAIKDLEKGIMDSIKKGGN